LFFTDPVTVTFCAKAETEEMQAISHATKYR